MNRQNSLGRQQDHLDHNIVLDRSELKRAAIKGDSDICDGPEKIAFPSISMPDDQQLKRDRLSVGASKRQAPTLDLLSLENCSCGQAKRRKGRKHPQDHNSFPVELSGARIDPTSSDLSNSSHANVVALSSGNTVESSLPPERFQYLLDFLGGKADAMGESRPRGL